MLMQHGGSQLRRETQGPAAGADWPQAEQGAQHESFVNLWVFLGCFWLLNFANNMYVFVPR